MGNIQRALSCYEIDTGSIENANISRIRSAYKINYPHGSIYLKKTRHGSDTPEKVYRLTQYLKKRKFYNIPDYIRTRDDKLYVRQDKCCYYITEWISGRECNFDDFKEVKMCTEALARFHIAASGKDGRKYFQAANKIKDLPGIFIKRCNKLLEYRKIIREKRIQSEFDMKYDSNIDFFYRQGLVAVDLLNKSDYYRLVKAAVDNREICHNGFFHQNLVIDSNNQIFITELDSVVRDIKMNDLGKFLCRILNKSQYAWNFTLAQDMIGIYSSIAHILKEELEMLLAIMLFPSKFYKLGKKRYEKHKLWSEGKYLSKLNKQLDILQKQNEFSAKFLEYYEIDVGSTRGF
jgi:CotS family spore coat protein